MGETQTTAERLAPRRSLCCPWQGPPRRGREHECGLLCPVQEVDHVVVAESAVAALADPEERELAAITEPLDRVHMQMQHLGDLGRRQQLADLVRHHGWRLSSSWALKTVPSAWAGAV